ncbi:MAG: NAD(P)-binding domain-containing protein [Pseudomonadota bacterium]|nr:NAD(P)-binding domain-containing protein [Pseudomonadota bacterium]
MTPSSPLPRCCIIGAGCSGLATVKALNDRSIPHDCFEMSDRIGGVWAFGNPNGRAAAYRSLHIDTSKQRLQFDDFPIPDHYPHYPHHSQVLSYFEAYAEHFDLRRTITFNSEVRRAARTSDGLWRIELATGGERLYDALFVANGHHWNPRWPTPPYPGAFDGRQIHVHSYRDPFDPIDMRGKRVLVVGMGNSAMDIASELCPRHVTRRLFVSARRGVYIFPRFMLGVPADKGKQSPWLPLSLQRAFGRAVYRIVMGRPEDYGLPKPDHRLYESHGTVSDTFPGYVAAGDIAMRPAIERLDGGHVVFTDGRREAIDVIVWATGYNVSFPFFDPDFLEVRDNRLPLYKRMIRPGIDNLFFLGLLQSSITVVAVAERQAKWLASHLAGDLALPGVADMRQAISADEKRHQGRYYASARHTMQVDQDIYVWELEQEARRGRKRKAQRHGPGWLPVPARAAAGESPSHAA